MAPGGIQQLSCCTADYLGAARSLLSVSTLALSGSISLHMGSYSSLPALVRAKNLFKSRTALWLELCPSGFRGRDQGCFPPTAVNPVTAHVGGKRGQNVSCDTAAHDGCESKQVSNTSVPVLICWERGRGEIQLLIRISVPLKPS